MSNNLAETAAHNYGQGLFASEQKKTRRIYLALFAVLAAAVVFAILMGRYEIDALMVFKVFLYGIVDGVIYLLELPTLIPGIAYSIPNPLPAAWNEMSLLIMWSVRIPRIAGAFLVGGGLAVTGASYQGVFRNPLVSESILGVSAGASLGAVLAIVIGATPVLRSAMAFGGAILAVVITYAISRTFKGNPVILLVLAGTVVGSMFTAVFSLFQYILAKDGNFQDGRIRDLLFWLMGSLANIKMADLLLVAVVVGVCCFVLYRMRWKLNVLSLGEEEARSLGVDTRRTRLIIIICATLMAAVSVSVCGSIGWVGLIIPQAVRIIIGPDNCRLMPCAFLSGGIFLLLADIASRALVMFEIPIGIVTAVIGTPVFLILLTRLGKGWVG